jgi:formylglycine-generating enzyme required for sulfatase activity
MTTGDGSANRPAEDTWQRVDRVVHRFEEAWEAGPRPVLEDYLPEGSPDRLAVLVELVHVDLERRLKAGEPARVEQYMGHFLDLAGDREAVLDLIAAEYRLRRDREPGLAPDEYQDRFPRYEPDLPARLHEGTTSGSRRRAGPADPGAAQRGSATPASAPSPSADRNLLFGVLALQMDFIGRDALIRALQAWVFAKAKPLGQILAEQGALSAERRELLEALVREHLRQHGGDPQQSLASLSSLGSAHAVLAGIADPDVQASLARVSMARSEPTFAPTSPLSAGVPAVPGQRFRILRPHARGGLGEVYVALDGELHREVALKEIQPAHAGHPESRARFLLEAEVTGGLEHPGVVPVYGLGTYADGRPYYAMRFIKGDNLKEAIERFHRADGPGRDPGERALALRQLLGRFVDVCQAVAYAHSRGVLHRDLKPGNVLLGPYGETLVVDWGLAKVVGRPEGGADSSEGTLRPPSASDAAPTEMGRVVGTPAYMSPEQASGQLDQLGPASDVYSLGATLYALLCGRPPFEGGGVAEVLERVRKGAVLPPRQVHGGVPAALDAVCRKAMAVRPEDRYLSAQTLAEEIERWLADEPVTAYREPMTARLARWRRRHPTLVTATVLVLLTLIGAVVVGGLIFSREQERARAERERALVLAEADALQDATVATVPVLLKDLEAHRADVQSRLRAQWRDSALSDGRRLRLGLALADDADVRARLVELARKADDPQEVLLVRDALVPKAAEVAPLLWQQVQQAATPATERFRLLALLATLDRSGASWRRQAGPTVEQLLAANPLHLGAWKAALEPVRGLLLKPLGQEFRSSTEPERRRLVATLLADFAADQADTLTDLLLDADERQYAVLLPKVQAHRDRAVARLTAELDRASVSDWQDASLDPAWGKADAVLMREVEAAEGLVADRFALCQTLPLERFDAVATGLAKSGYRLTQLRPQGASPQVRVAALWTRDGQKARWAHGLTAAAVTKRDAEERGRGLVPLDVTGYQVQGEGAERYAAVWGPTEAGQAETRLYAGVPGGKLAATQEALRKDRFWPRTQGYVQMDEDMRHAGIWAKPSGAAEELRFEQGVMLGGTEALYGRVQSPSNLQVDLRLSWEPGRLVALLGAGPGAGLSGLPWGGLGFFDGSPGVPPQAAFSAVWRSSAERVSEAVYGLDPQAHRERWRELAGRGYRPEALTVVEAGGGRLLAGSVWHLPVVPEADKDALARRQAQAAVALLQLGAPGRVWPLLEHQPDPRVRSFLIHRLGSLQTGVQVLLGRLAEEREVSRRRALVLSLGSYPVEVLPADARAAWLDRLRQWYREEADAGLHGAVEWLLRRWGDGAEVARIEKGLARGTGGLPGGRHWYVNGQGQTLVVVPTGTAFWMGSPGAEAGRIATNEPLHRVHIPRSFAIAAKEVTVEQFLRSEPERRYVSKYSPRPDGPLLAVSWYEAAEYCNWLSAQEGIPKEEWCYLPNRGGQYDDGMRRAPGYLSKRGYRLPTEAEWEFACRAGAVTSRYYGEADELLREYAWYNKTTNNAGVRSGGLLKPNDLGLFDLYGNALEWVQDPAVLYRWPGGNGATEDMEFNSEVGVNISCLLRGGSFAGLEPFVRTAFRSMLRPSIGDITVGFRVARTYP